MMFEIKMPVVIYRGDECIGQGELLPNGRELALCPDQEGLQLLNYGADTELVEEKIPMKIFREGAEIGDGELLQTGEYICLCPFDELDLMDPKSLAELRVAQDGWHARLDICRNAA